MTRVRWVMAGVMGLAVLLFGCGPLGEPVALLTDALKDGTVGAGYGQTIRATGGCDTCSGGLLKFASGLPPGLSVFSPDQGIISGVPTAAGDYNVRLTAGDEGEGNSVSKTVPMKVFPAVSFTTQSLPDGAVGIPYNATLATQGGKAPLLLSLATGALPAGLSFESSTGVISGTPTGAGASGPLRFNAQDANNALVAADLSIAVSP